jgi:inhibitor of cysteine peptidase
MKSKYVWISLVSVAAILIITTLTLVFAQQNSKSSNETQATSNSKDESNNSGKTDDTPAGNQDRDETDSSKGQANSNETDSKKDSSGNTVPTANPALKLPSLGTKEKLLGLLKENISQTNDMRPMMKAADGLASRAESSVAAADSSAASSNNADYSQTNIQTEGVDEGDILKTDGTYLYKISTQYRNVTIVKAVPSTAMSVVNSIKFEDPNFWPTELYVDAKNLIVIGNSYVDSPIKPMSSSSGAAADKRIAIQYGTNLTQALIYDISNKSNIKLARKIEVEGNYVTSRKIKDAVYMVTNKWLDVYTIMNPDQPSPMPLTPIYRDSIAKSSSNYQTIPFDQIQYFPYAVVPNYLLISSFDLTQTSQPVQIKSYLGSGENVYASQDNLYVAVTEMKFEPIPSSTPLTSPSSSTSSTALAEPAPRIAMIPIPSETFTHVYKFALAPAKVELIGEGTVPGTILNQFSMDEFEDHLRIATTKGNTWSDDEATTSKNNIYILNNKMQITGKLEDLAKGERIYSVRFMGKRGYMVTFKTVDPLFVLDLANPKAPKVLGELKIPGYSSYLHPYDENHIIGFGVDTTEITNEWDPKQSKIAITQGMKIALFDVTNVNKPVEKFKESIGVRGTYSELLYNHKALLFSKEKQLFAFPVQVNESGNTQSDSRDYGKFAFQGLYVYQLNLEQGFKLKARISHLNADETLKMQEGTDYFNNKLVQRGVYIGQSLYTISEDILKANDLSSLKEISQIKLN